MIRKEYDDFDTLMANIREQRQKMLEYCEKREDKYLCPLYYDDLLTRKLKISEIPIEYRTPTAYIYACRAIRGLPEGCLFTEIPLIEMQLLSDINEWYRRGDREKARELKGKHRDYFLDQEHFHCKEDPDILSAFFKKNGFTESEDGRSFVFDMRSYHEAPDGGPYGEPDDTEKLVLLASELIRRGEKGKLAEALKDESKILPAMKEVGIIPHDS